MAGGNSIYTKGLFQVFNEDWYHGELTGEEAEQALKASSCDCFLIRLSQGVLVLSLVHGGEFHHITIKHGPGRYELENSDPAAPRYRFAELEDLVTHYSSFPISCEVYLTLGQACMKTPKEERQGKVHRTRALRY
jgi:hypothetical protein